MKAYEKPDLGLCSLQQTDFLSSLNNWLAEKELQQAGITTYLVNS